MEIGDKDCSSGYGRPPWTFKGRALYQLHLVKGKTARECIRKDLRLVEAFGYTLGGFFLANYDDSPAGTFDENVPCVSDNKLMGPAITLSLPSYSGHTEYIPELLKYSCRIRCRVRAEP